MESKQYLENSDAINALFNEIKEKNNLKITRKDVKSYVYNRGVVSFLLLNDGQMLDLKA